MTPSDLATTCDLHGEPAPFTGKVDVEGDRLIAVCWCPACKAELRVWRPADAPALRAWQTARSAASAGWERSWATLRSGDAGKVRALIVAAAADPTLDLPLVRLNELPGDLRLPVAAWLTLVLDHPAFAPSVTDAERIEEALAAGLATGDSAVSTALLARRGRYADDAWETAFRRIQGRVPADADARALGPLLSGLRGTPARGFAEARWFAAPLKALLAGS